MQPLSNDPSEDIAPISPFGQIDYGYTADQLSKLAESYAPIKEIKNRKDYDAARAAATTLTKTRTEIEARRKVLKSESLQFGRLVDSTGKDLMAVVEPQEQRIKALIKEIDDKKAEEKAERERIEKDRIDGIRARIDAIRAIPIQRARSNSADVQAAIDELSTATIDQTYAEFADEAASALSDTMSELDELLRGARHDERIAKKDAEEKAKIEAEQKAESERLEIARAELRDLADELQQQRSAVKAEQDRIEANKQAEQDRIEAEQIAKSKADAKAKEKAEREALIEASKPDVEKLEAYVSALINCPAPKLSSDLGRSVLKSISVLIVRLGNEAGEIISEIKS